MQNKPNKNTRRALWARSEQERGEYEGWVQLSGWHARSLSPEYANMKRFRDVGIGQWHPVFPVPRGSVSLNLAITVMRVWIKPTYSAYTWGFCLMKRTWGSMVSAQLVYKILLREQVASVLWRERIRLFSRVFPLTFEVHLGSQLLLRLTHKTAQNLLHPCTHMHTHSLRQLHLRIFNQ